jgi:PAS domain S-box-containing protein
VSLQLFEFLRIAEAWPWFFVAAGGLIFQVYEYVLVRAQLGGGRQWTKAQNHARRMQLRAHSERIGNHLVYSVLSGVWLTAILLAAPPKSLPSTLGLIVTFGFPTGVGVATARMVWSSAWDRLDRQALMQPGPAQQQVLAIVAADPRTLVVIGWDEGAERLFGWTRDEAVGKNVAELLVPEAWRERHLAGVERWRSTGAPTALDRQMRVTALTKDRGEIPVVVELATQIVAGAAILVAYFRPPTSAA